MTRTYDIVVLGGGPGGYVAAIRAAQLGKSVAVVEKAALGGTCLHKGCIPSKTLLRSAEVHDTIRRGAEFGIRLEGPAAVDFAKVQERKGGIVEELHRGVKYLMDKYGIDVVYGTGRIMGPSIFSPQTGSVAVEQPDGETVTLTNERLIIATGSRPRIVPGLEPDGRFVLTSDDALELPALPRSLAIVGGGIIGVEWASMMSHFGVAVTVVEAADRLLPSEEKDISREMAAALKRRGVMLLTGAKLLGETLQKRETADGGADREVSFEAEQASGRVTVTAEAVLVAVGRAPNVEGIGLENTDVALERGAVRVNGWMQTSEPHIYAIGDVVGGMQMAHAASSQGIIAVEHICGSADRPYDPWYVPRAVFSQPEVAAIGMTEQQAKDAGYAVKTAKIPFRSNAKALVYGETGGFVKIVADETTNDVLGVHMIGAKVTELIGEASLARFLEATPWEIGAAIHPHPTLSETIGEAGLWIDGRSTAM